MTKKELRVFAPATVANVACGFDIFGFALDRPGDELTVRLVAEPGVKITKISGDQGRLSRDAQRNTAGISVIKLLEYLNVEQGVEIELVKKMPLGSGLGSSGASAAGSVFAVNTLLGSPLSRKELIPFAMEGERVACASPHADNVAPSLLGGFILVRSYEPLDVISIPIKQKIYCSLLVPKIEIRTESSREILPKAINLSQMVKQTGNAAALIAGLMQGDFAIIAKSLMDIIAEPVRSQLIPGFYAIKNAALAAGALGCSISGSGPTIFAISSSEENAKDVGKRMYDTCLAQGLSCEIYLSGINQQGVVII